MQRQVCGTSATSDAAAAAVKERHANIVSPTRGDNGFLCFVEFPAGSEPPDVLCLIRIAEHHFLPALNPRAVPGQLEQRAEDVLGAL